MARKRIFPTTKFNGGMTNDIRNTSDLSKCAFTSHFDIFGDPHEMAVMPGYISDMYLDGVEDGMKDYKIRAFWYDSLIWCAGTREDGTGCKLFFKTDPTDTNWTPGFVNSNPPDGDAQEGTYQINDAPYARLFTEDGNAMYLTTTQSDDAHWTQFAGASGVTDDYDEFDTANAGNENPRQLVRGNGGFSERIYYNGPTGDVNYLNGSTFANANYATSNYYVTGLAESSRGLWLIGYTFQPYNTEVRLWDRVSPLADITVNIPNSRGGAIGVTTGVPVVVVDENFDSLKSAASKEEQQNGQSGVAVYAIVSGGADLLYRFTSPNIDDGVLVPANFSYKDSFVFYAKMALDAGATKTREGIWAVGRKNSSEPIAITLLLDTSTLGTFNGFFGFGSNMYIAHGDDWSISKLDSFSSGDFDVTATRETLMYGADTPYEKHLNGINVTTPDLPDGATVSCYYRKSTDDDFTLMGTSTSGKSHSFTKAEGSPIGGFTEIQFKIEVLGKTCVKSYTVSMEEHDNLPFDL